MSINRKYSIIDTLFIIANHETILLLLLSLLRDSRNSLYHL